ncbi:MAG: tricarballylate utilization 4Fe-4S protein TcuB [Rhodospirillaceae bacterium]
MSATSNVIGQGPLAKPTKAGGRGIEHSSANLTEADRLMTICNSCRYCQGLCAVFPAMELRRDFTEGDLSYMANLCHACGACFADCQFSPPHDFEVNVPKTMATLRAETYSRYAWPNFLSGLFYRNGLTISIITALSVAGFILGFIYFNNPELLWAVHKGPGAFYKLMPHNTMALLFGVAFVAAIIAIIMGAIKFWKDTSNASIAGSGNGFWQALGDSLKLRYLDGGGAGCSGETTQKKDGRKHAHHMTFYGFLLCFASTSVATLYHYGLGREAPYPWWDLPVILGTLGGIGLVIGPAGLLIEKFRRPKELQDADRFGMDTGFIAMLFLTSFTGLALLFLRETPLMGILLAIHLGVVFSLFLTLPYSKFVHGIYRFMALIRFAKESNANH